MMYKLPNADKNRYWLLGLLSIGTFLFGSDLEAEQAIFFMVGILVSDYYQTVKQEAKKEQLWLYF